jgi:hypothetical protein
MKVVGEIKEMNKRTFNIAKLIKYFEKEYGHRVVLTTTQDRKSITVEFVDELQLDYFDQVDNAAKNMGKVKK